MNPITWSPADAALRGALVATLLLLGAALVRERRSHVAAQVGSMLVLGLGVQTFATVPVVEHGWPSLWQAPLVGVSVGNSLLFWLFARALFEDGFQVKRRHVVGWLVVVTIGAGFCLALAWSGPQSAVTTAFRVVLRWTPAVFAFLVIRAAVSEWRGDLVEPRRRLRGFIVVAGAAYAASMVVVRLTAVGGLLSANAAVFDTAAMLFIMLVIGVVLLRASGGGMLFTTPVQVARPATTVAARVDRPEVAGAGAVANLTEPQPQSPPDPAQTQLAEVLDRLMQHELVYRVDDLTVGLLALKLGVPEYRLRRCINQRLGHSNFNAYINAWRLEHARRALADPAQRETGVLEIAMDAGFASIGPFNRAFKAASGITPTEFRRMALADS